MSPRSLSSFVIWSRFHNSQFIIRTWNVSAVLATPASFSLTRTGHSGSSFVIEIAPRDPRLLHPLAEVHFSRFTFYFLSHVSRSIRHSTRLTKTVYIRSPSASLKPQFRSLRRMVTPQNSARCDAVQIVVPGQKKDRKGPSGLEPAFSRLRNGLRSSPTHGSTACKPAVFVSALFSIFAG